jgi:hypothetical protein
MQAIKIFKIELKGPFSCTVRAFGNYDLQKVIWNEDKDELSQAQNAINLMTTQFGTQNFPQGANYSLEYYRDSAINTVAYILYKQDKAKVTKYHCLRA